jgi:hypothetical protein
MNFFEVVASAANALLAIANLVLIYNNLRLLRSLATLQEAWREEFASAAAAMGITPQSVTHEKQKPNESKTTIPDSINPRGRTRPH